MCKFCHVKELTKERNLMAALAKLWAHPVRHQRIHAWHTLERNIHKQSHTSPAGSTDYETSALLSTRFCWNTVFLFVPPLFLFVFHIFFLLSYISKSMPSSFFCILPSAHPCLTIFQAVSLVSSPLFLHPVFPSSPSPVSSIQTSISLNFHSPLPPK